MIPFRPLLEKNLFLPVQEDKLVSASYILDLFEQIVSHGENTGYPFITVHLDNILTNDSLINAGINVSLGDQIKIQKITTEGNALLSQQYLQHYLNIKPGDVFSRERILAVKNRLEEISFISAYKNPSVSILAPDATLQLYLNKKKSNQFDILLGLIPSSSQNTRFQLTGQVNIDMFNQFGRGERLFMEYESLQPGTQQLDLGFNYPFILDWPFGVDFQFSLYKRDSSYIDLDYSIGARYFISAQNQLRFYVRNISSNLLTIDTAAIIRTKMLPSVLDVRQNLLGIEYTLDKTNYRFNPRSGLRLNANISGGRKSIKKNNTITSLTDPEDPEFRYETLYQERPEKSFQSNIVLGGAFFIPIFKQSTIMVGIQNGWVGSDDILFDNELVRIGGTKLLRGFNQESFQVNLYSVFTIEYRILFNQNSNMFLFTDLSYIEKNTATGGFSDRPLGVGVGMNLETKIGIFGISYAIGKQKNSVFDFGEGKIHFGMVSIF